MGYVDECLEMLKRKNPGEPEYLQAVTEVLESVKEVVDKHEEEYRAFKVLETLLEPERSISFRVPWVDRNGELQINRGYRIQFNSALGPYKGGLRFHPTVNRSVMNFLAFEQTFKNALTGQSIGGGKGGSDFNPKGKTDKEVMNFCQSFMTELHKYIGPTRDVPAGDIGVGAREIGFLYGQYKRLTSHYEGALSGKGLSYGGSLVRTEATGYGVCYIANEMLKANGKSFEGATVVVSGSGNVATYAVEKAEQLGAKVVTVSDSNGYIYDPNGIQVEVVKQLKEVERARISEYANRVPGSEYHEGKKAFEVKADIVLPCAIQNELDLEHAKMLVENGVFAVVEGANMPTTPDATVYFQENGVLFMPGKASNAGGVAVSALEMAQNASRRYDSFEQVDKELHDIMVDIWQQVSSAAADYNDPTNYVKGANIAGFRKVVKAMREQGWV